MTEQQQPSHKQWSYITKAGEVIELAEFLPVVDGCFMNPTKNMRKAIVNNYPDLVDEYDEAVERRAKQINFLDDLINKIR